MMKLLVCSSSASVTRHGHTHKLNRSKRKEELMHQNDKGPKKKKREINRIYAPPSFLSIWSSHIQYHLPSTCILYVLPAHSKL